MRIIKIEGYNKAKYQIKIDTDRNDNSNYNLRVNVLRNGELKGGCRMKQDATERELINFALQFMDK